MQSPGRFPGPLPSGKLYGLWLERGMAGISPVWPKQGPWRGEDSGPALVEETPEAPWLLPHVGTQREVQTATQKAFPCTRPHRRLVLGFQPPKL